MEVLIDSPMDVELTQVIDLSGSPDGSRRARLDNYLEIFESRIYPHEIARIRLGVEQWLKEERQRLQEEWQRQHLRQQRQHLRHLLQQLQQHPRLLLQLQLRLQRLPLLQRQLLHLLPRELRWQLLDLHLMPLLPHLLQLQPRLSQELVWLSQLFLQQLLQLFLQQFPQQFPQQLLQQFPQLLQTGGVQLYDRGFGRGGGIGNGFDANDHEQSPASINGELSTTYERASDYLRHVRTENGEVQFHMNSFVNVDGRVYNLAQEPHLNNLRSSQLINKVMLAITGQTGIALMFAALNDNSSPFPPVFYLVVAANTVGFITTMISMLLRIRKPWASGVLAKMGAVAGSSAVILAMGMALHMRHIWAFLFLCGIAAAAVLFGQT